MRTYVVPYACRLIKGSLCPDTQARCDMALKVAWEKSATIVIGVGSRNEKDHFAFSDAMVKYFTDRGWSKERIIVNPSGWTTLYESNAACEAIEDEGGGEIIAVTSWYHALRVRLTWKIALGRSVQVRTSRKGYAWYYLPREVLAFPVNAFKIFRFFHKKGA